MFNLISHVIYLLGHTSRVVYFEESCLVKGVRCTFDLICLYLNSHLYQSILWINLRKVGITKIIVARHRHKPETNPNLIQIPDMFFFNPHGVLIATVVDCFIIIFACILVSCFVFIKDAEWMFCISYIIGLDKISQYHVVNMIGISNRYTFFVESDKFYPRTLSLKKDIYKINSNVTMHLWSMIYAWYAHNHMGKSGDKHKSVNIMHNWTTRFHIFLLNIRDVYAIRFTLRNIYGSLIPDIAYLKFIIFFIVRAKLSIDNNVFVTTGKVGEVHVYSYKDWNQTTKGPQLSSTGSYMTGLYCHLNAIRFLLHWFFTNHL